MTDRVFTAALIHDGHRFLSEGAAIEVSGVGEIIAVHKDGYKGASTYLEGILCPGFINAHCHLELSHMKGIIAEGTGLIPFLQSVMSGRFNFTDEQKKAARHEAFNELYNNGVVAVGDIANTTDTIDLRALDKIHFHTFTECIGFTDTSAPARLDAAKDVYAAFASQHTGKYRLKQSITPHAPYSVSEKLFKLIGEAYPDSLLSIHNQESGAENEYYQNKTGSVRDLLAGFGIDDSFFQPSGKTSLQTYLPWLGNAHDTILVHNTFSTEEDVRFAESRAEQTFWCLCPAANLYIEGRLPDVKMLSKLTDNICLGTDSLASNNSLSILKELMILTQSFPEINLETLLRWATKNGAVALGMDSATGSFEAGKTPGMLQLQGIDEGTAVLTRIL